MTITVALDVRCDWCGMSIAAMHHSLQRVPLHRLNEALDALIERATEDRGGYVAGHAIGGPPARPLHLCRACHDRGRPPVRLPAKVTKKRAA